MPSTPSDTVAMREGNKVPPSSVLHGRIARTIPGSMSRSTLLMATASSCGSRLERTTSHVQLAGDCRRGRNIAGCWSSVRFLYFPSSTRPTTRTRVPSLILKYRPIACGMEPSILLANSGFTTATRGAFVSSCHEKALTANKDVPDARETSGDTVYIYASAAVFDGLR